MNHKETETEIVNIFLNGFRKHLMDSYANQKDPIQFEKDVENLILFYTENLIATIRIFDSYNEEQNVIR